MVKEMQHDGLKPLKMTNIAKTNADFKTELLPQFSKGKVTELTKEKTAKEKMQERIAKQAKQKALAV